MNGGPDLVRACLQIGERAAAEQATAALGAMAARSTSRITPALAGWAEGLLSGAPGTIVEAAVALASAGRAPEAARAYADAAVVAAGAERAAGVVGAAGAAGAANAKRLAAEAMVGFAALGAEQWGRRLRLRLRAEGVEVRAPRRLARPTSGWSSLTPSEQAVVRLIGSGLTNGQVAANLVVSRRTVESHLVRVYSKLGFTSRAQLVAAAARR
jgi:DNA-binding CsgD family transcriptional regulator